MHWRKRPIKFLLLSLFTLFGIAGLTFLFPPDYKLKFAGMGFNTTYFFLTLLFLFSFSTSTYLLKNTAHGVLVAGFIISIFVFRLNGLSHPFFLVLLAGLFLTLELLFAYRK